MRGAEMLTYATGLITELDRISTMFTLWSIADMAGSKQSPAWSELLREAEQAIDRAKQHAAAIRDESIGFG
jgi:hypothetical protein